MITCTLTCFTVPRNGNDICCLMCSVFLTLLIITYSWVLSESISNLTFLHLSSQRFYRTFKIIQLRCVDHKSFPKVKSLNFLHLADALTQSNLYYNLNFSLLYSIFNNAHRCTERLWLLEQDAALH